MFLYVSYQIKPHQARGVFSCFRNEVVGGLRWWRVGADLSFFRPESQLEQRQAELGGAFVDMNPHCIQFVWVFLRAP